MDGTEKFEAIIERTGATHVMFDGYYLPESLSSKQIRSNFKDICQDVVLFGQNLQTDNLDLWLNSPVVGVIPASRETHTKVLSFKRGTILWLEPIAETPLHVLLDALPEEDKKRWVIHSL